MIRDELKKYIEETIMKKYDENNIGGHGKEHIETVINRSFELKKRIQLKSRR